MKNSIAILRHLYIALFILISGNVFSQKIAENRVDEFTKNKIKRTSWERAISQSDLGAFIRFSQINDDLFLDLKLMYRNVFSIPEGGEIMLKFGDEDILSFINNEYSLSCTGCGSIGLGGSALQGVSLSFILSKQQIEKFKSNTLLKIRIITTNGYIEGAVKEKFAKNISEAAILM